MKKKENNITEKKMKRKKFKSRRGGKKNLKEISDLQKYFNVEGWKNRIHLWPLEKEERHHETSTFKNIQV